MKLAPYKPGDTILGGAEADINGTFTVEEVSTVEAVHYVYKGTMVRDGESKQELLHHWDWNDIDRGVKWATQ